MEGQPIAVGCRDAEDREKVAIGGSRTFFVGPAFPCVDNKQGEIGVAIGESQAAEVDHAGASTTARSPARWRAPR
jgi:hypothetical protein